MSEARQNAPSFTEMTEPPQKRSKMSKVKRKRRIKRIIKIAVWILILVALALGGLYFYNRYQAEQTAASTTTYSQAVATIGTLDKYIYGTGNIQAASQPTVLAETDGTLDELRVDIGDTVEEGQILAVLENDALDEEIRQLEYDLWSLDNDIASTNVGSDVTTIKAPVAGRVVAINAQVGDDALAVYRDQGSVAIISMDGRMNVSIEVDEDVTLALGDTVTVQGDGFTAAGTVTDLYMQGTRATITVADDTLPMDSDVTVLTADSQQAGSGTLVINKPMVVSSFGGVIDEIKVAVGDEVTRKQTLFTLSDSPGTMTMEDLRLQRETAAESLETAKKNRENLIVRAPAGGVIATVNVSEGDEITSGTTLLSILEGEDMVLTIAVDELDVVSVEEGQAVNITIDALPDLLLTGTVEKISPVGSGDSGVTTYDVRLNFDAAGTGVRSGMNASGEVQVAHVENALYIPVEALMTIGDQTYVMVAGGSESTTTTSGAGEETLVADAGETSVSPITSDGQSFGGQAGGQPPEGMSGEGMPDFSSMSDEDRQAMRENFSQEGGQMPQMAAEGTTSQEGTLRAVTTGLVNDDYVEILEGLSAGEIVLYTSTSSSSSNMMMGGGGGSMSMFMF